MFAEIALTPWVFDEGSNTDFDAWQRQLSELAHRMFRKGEPSPIIVSNLADGFWLKQAGRIVAKISDPRARDKCHSLLRQIESRCALVVRPQKCNPLRDNELAWSAEAVASARHDEPIERIVASAIHSESSERVVRSISEVEDEDFWIDIPPDSSLKMTIADQVGLLHKLCVHSHVLCLVLPFIKGGDDDETRFAQQLVKSALRRPSNFASAEIEIHTQPNRGDKLPDSWVNNVRKSFEECLRPGQNVRIVFWRDVVERAVVAGFNTEHPTRTLRRTLWCVVQATHFALPKPRLDPTPPMIRLARHAEARVFFDRYCRDGAARDGAPGFLRATNACG